MKTPVTCRGIRTAWWRQLIIIAGGMFVALIGGLCVYPTGPGSSRIVFVFLMGYAIILTRIGSKITKITGCILFCICLVFFVLATKNKSLFEQKMRVRFDQRPLWNCGETDNH